MTSPDERLGRGHRAFDSFQSLDAQAVELLYEANLDREEGLFDAYRVVLNYDTIHVFRDRDKVAYKDIYEAAAVAALEMAALELSYPQTHRLAQPFPDLYRFLRTIELFHHHPRGGNAVLVGAGLVIPDYLAQYVQPPDFFALQKVVQTTGDKPLRRKLAEAVALGDTPKPPPVNLLSGKATAIEPTHWMLTWMGSISAVYHIPPDRISVKPYTLGEVIDANVFPRQQQRIIWHRAEPQGFIKEGSTEIDYDYIAEVLETFHDSLQSSGDIVITIGGGHSDDGGQELRREFIVKVKELVQQGGFRTLKTVPTFFKEDERFDILFGYPAAGITGAVVARKK